MFWMSCNEKSALTGWLQGKCSGADKRLKPEYHPQFQVSKSNDNSLSDDLR